MAASWQSVLQGVQLLVSRCERVNGENGPFRKPTWTCEEKLHVGDAAQAANAQAAQRIARAVFVSSLWRHTAPMSFSFQKGRSCSAWPFGRCPKEKEPPQMAQSLGFLCGWSSLAIQRERGCLNEKHLAGRTGQITLRKQTRT